LTSAQSTTSAGARFYRCALQVNPFAYLNRHSVPHGYKDEDEYNKALLSAIQSAGIEVICVTDHYRVKTGLSLVEAARKPMTVTKS
jgi:hypothetical protein